MLKIKPQTEDCILSISCIYFLISEDELWHTSTDVDTFATSTASVILTSRI